MQCLAARSKSTPGECESVCVYVCYYFLFNILGFSFYAYFSTFIYILTISEPFYTFHYSKSNETKTKKKVEEEIRLKCKLLYEMNELRK